MKSIMQYLNGTRNMCIFLGRKDASINGYANVDFVGNVDNRRSMLSNVFLFVGGAISWRSCFQDCTSISTTNVEYVATSKTCKKAL